MSRLDRICYLLTIGAMACASTQLAHVNQPVLTLRASRPIALPGQRIVLTAELVGGEDDELHYCPNLVWTWADGTQSAEEGDCAPWNEHEGYQRIWTHEVGLAMAGTYPIEVRMEKAGRVVARATVTLQAMGGE